MSALRFLTNIAVLRPLLRLEVTVAVGKDIPMTRGGLRECKRDRNEKIFPPISTPVGLTVNSSAGHSQANPFIKIIEQEFMHAIDKTAVPTHVLNTNDGVPNETEANMGVSDTDMDDGGEDGSFSELGNQNTNWPHKAVLLLIDLYKKHLPKFNSKNIKKKGVWNLLSQEMKRKGYDLSGEACDKKFRALKHRYKIIMENINATGRRNRKWEYFDLMGKLLEDDPQFKVNSSSVSDESHEEEEEGPQDEDVSLKNHVIWTHSRKLLLLKLCRDHKNDDQSTDVWKTVSDEMKEKGCDISADVCEKKFRYFKYRFKKIMECEDPIQEGNKWVYFEIMKSLLEGDSIFKHKSNSAPVPVAQFKIETGGNIHEESEDVGNGNEARGDSKHFSDTYMMEELEDAQDDSLTGTYIPTVWSHRAILMLIKLYKTHTSAFKSPTVKKSDVWKTISTKMQSMGHNYNAEACDKKFRCLKYRYSKIMEDSEIGRGKKWQYFQAMRSVFEGDQSYEPIKIVSTMTLPPDEIEDHSSTTSNYGLRKRSSPPAISTFKIRGASPAPRKRLKTSIYDEPPSWFLSFVESQNKHMEEVKALQRASLKVAKERNAILKSFTDILLKRMKAIK
ncbi:uncharacterized protein LOC135200242 isoform X5 [Macrobrachium nipponense]|uniref:uncharacterized protein LOC135200242 isoform X5 n=1 Tax=Macrobrachium nipponense TaxID=159736 RepID=UPI0030C81997